MGKGPLVYPKSCIQLVAYGYRKNCSYLLEYQQLASPLWL